MLRLSFGQDREPVLENPEGISMDNPTFFKSPKPMTLSEVIELTGASPRSDSIRMDDLVSDVAPLTDAEEGQISFLDNAKYVALAGETGASAVFCHKKYADKLPVHTQVLVSSDPYRAFATTMRHFYPDALRPLLVTGETGHAATAFIHGTAELEDNVIIEPGASVGPGAKIGRGSIIASSAIIGPNVCIGRNCSVGPGAVVQHSLIGNSVILHPGVKCGQDGFGFAMGPGGHLKVPQIGRVIVQDHVEIGANSTIDRGANRDTIIGEGTKIDNLVQVAHNVVIGRHCVLVSHVGISGSTTLEDFVVLGGKVGVVGHLTIGMGAQIAGSSNVNSDVPPGARWGGTPAKPVKEWFREMTKLKQLASRN